MQILSDSAHLLGIGFSMHEPLKEKSTPSGFHPTWHQVERSPVFFCFRKMGCFCWSMCCSCVYKGRETCRFSHQSTKVVRGFQKSYSTMSCCPLMSYQKKWGESFQHKSVGRVAKGTSPIRSILASLASQHSCVR